MFTTSVTDENCLLLYRMTTFLVSGTWIDSMLMVKTAADGVALDDLVAHDEDVMCCQHDRLVSEMLEEIEKDDELGVG